MTISDYFSCTFTNFHQIVKKMIKQTFFIIMFYQLFILTRQYIVSNHLIEINFKSTVKIPLILLEFDVNIGSTLMKQYYPEFYENSKFKSKLKEKFLKDFFTQKWSLLRNVTSLDAISIECSINSNDIVLDCSNLWEMISIDEHGQFLIKYQFLSSTKRF